jgi:hypothetical protein
MLPPFNASSVAEVAGTEAAPASIWQRKGRGVRERHTHTQRKREFLRQWPGERLGKRYARRSGHAVVGAEE